MDFFDQMEEDMHGGNIYFPYEAHQATGRGPENLQRYQCRSAQPSSTLSSSRRGTSNRSPMIAISPSVQETSSTRRNVYQPNDDFHLFVDDTEMPGVISPHPDQDVIYMQRQFSEPDIQDTNSILNHTPQQYGLDEVFTRNQNNASSPWNGLPGRAVDTYQTYQNTEYQGSLLNVLGYSQTQGLDDAISPGASSTGWLSDNFGPMSQDDVDMRLETRPRGGRPLGSNLPEESVDNVRKVRRIGACLRCAALKERCSTEMPCSSCARNDGRKWDGCVRSFTALIDVFKPKILATRLQSQAITQFMIDHTKSRPQPIYFDLPLNFGFGKTFHGFRGAEYDPITVETQYSHAVGRTEQHPESPLYGRSIQVFPTNSGSREVRNFVYRWLKDTLKSERSIEDWLRVCFSGDDVEWIRRLLRMSWQYSVQSWDEQRSNPHQVDELQLDENLLCAWMVALLTTMLSLSITIPQSARQGVLNNLRSVRPDYACSWSSRPINKCVKSMFFDIYKRLVEKVMFSMEAFKKRPLKNISERHLGHVHCMTILIVVVTWQLQTSLMDNLRLSPQDNTNLLEKTFEHIREVETAFKNTVLYVRHKNRDWFKKNYPRNGTRGEDGIPIITPRLQGIVDIKLDYSEEISRHRTAKLEAVMDLNLPFHVLNMQRVFAFYFDPIPAEGRSRAAR